MKKITDLLRGMHYVTESFAHGPVSFSAGTIGGFATNPAVNVEKAGYTPIMAVLSFAKHPGSYHVMPSFTEAKDRVYLNIYRTTNAAGNFPDTNEIEFVVLYKKD